MALNVSSSPGFSERHGGGGGGMNCYDSPTEDPEMVAPAKVLVVTVQGLLTDHLFEGNHFLIHAPLMPPEC